MTAPRGGHPSPSTASAAARPAGFARLAGARRGLVGSAHALAAAALLALFGGLALPATVQAQAGICGRTSEVVTQILREISGVSDCAKVTATHLAAIDDLNLRNKNISALAAGDFDGLTSLNQLRLDENALTELPADVFDGLTMLDKLQLDDNQLTELPADVFDGLTSLELLRLHDNALTELPADVFDGLTSLNQLSLYDNSLTDLPDGVFDNLTALYELSLYSNSLTGLRAGVFDNLTALEVLSLHTNSLTELPDGVFDNNTALYDLKLYENPLTELRAGVFHGLTELEILELHNNQLQSLPDGLFSGLTALEILSLGGNLTNPMPLTVTVEKVGTNQVRAKVLAGAPFAVDIPVTLVDGTLAAGATMLRVAAGAVEGTAVTVTRTSGTTEAVTVDVDLSTPPTLPSDHTGYGFAKATTGLPATILPSAGDAPSSDATLSGLKVTAGGTDLVTFASGTTDYTAMVANDVDEVTVTATKNDSGATIEYLDGDDATLDDADTGVTDLQVTLAEGDNVIKVKVTAEDTNATETYTVTVSRAAAASTCTLNTGDLWCGVVTVADLGSAEGYGFSLLAGTLVGDLTDNSGDRTFRIGTAEHDVYRVAVSSFGLSFAVTRRTSDGVQSPGLHDDDRARLHLHVDGHSASFAFSDAAISGSLGYEWSGASLDWSSTSSVTLRVREATPPDAPTEFTAGVGDTQVTLAWKAAALESGVTGHEFRYKTDGDYPENWTAIANSGPDETNEDSFTVTGLTNEVAHTFELHAVNAAGAGDSATAGPVTPTPGICDRTEKIQDAILGEISGVDDCAAVTVAHLASITSLGAFGLSTSNQGITSLQKGDFAGLTALTILDLSLNDLTSLPEGIFAGLDELAELNLRTNELESLPEGAFDGLVTLAHINLSGNSLTELRAGAFAGLSALQLLELINNDLGSLPEELFSGLTALTGLYLNGNDLGSLPEELFTGLTALEILALNANKLTTLPEGLFSGLTALHDLHLYGNDLNALPEGLFSGLTALTRLRLYDNDLDSLPEDLFSGLTALTQLLLSSNDLGSLPEGLFTGLTSLTRISLENNQLNALPEGLFTGLTELEIITLGGNPTDPLPVTVTVEKVGTDQVRAKVLAGAPFAVDIPVTLVNGTLTGSVTVLSVAAGEVDGTAVTMTRTAGTTAAVTVDVDLTTPPTLPLNHTGYIFKKATANLPATILPDATNAAPAFTSSTTFNPAENQTAVGTVEASDDDSGDEITGYALNGGADQALFSINNSGALTFQAAPNYEDPQDADTDNAYVVVVRATSGTGARVKTTDQTITVTVMDEDEQPDKPAKPTLTAGSGSSTSLVASWTAPGLNGGPELTGYEVQYQSRASATDAWSTAVDWTHTTTTTTTTITGLTADTEYRVQVRALNGETPSAWSDPSEPVSPNSTATNNAPVFSGTPTRTVPENSAAGTNVGAVIPEATDVDNDALTYSMEGTDATSFAFDASTRQITTIAGVDYNYEATQNSYSVTVKASDGTASATIVVIINLTDVDEQPDKPAKPTVTAVSGSHTSLAARWTKPGLNGGPDITGYRVQYREGTSGWVNVTHNGAGVTRTITGLTAGTEYQVRVRALNGETPSAWSDPSDSVIPNAEVVLPTVGSVAVKSRPQSGDTYGWGETIVFTLTFSQKVRVTGQPQPTLVFDLGGSTREARYTGITDTDVDSDPRPRPRPEGVKVHFAYTVQPGDRDTDGIQVGELASAIDLGGARIQSAADLVDADGHKVDGVDADLAHAALGPLPGHKVDGGTAQPPAGSGITIIDTHGNPLANNRLTIREGTRGRYGLKLNTRPTHTVRVAAIASDGDPDLQVLPTAEATKAITPDEWETPFYMEPRAAIDDDEENGERVFLNRSFSTDPAYHDLTLPDVVVVEDDRDDDEDSSQGTTAEPLTAVFEGLPAAHDGETAFTFRIVFSEAVAVTAEAMRTRVLTVTGGAVTGAARVDGEIGVWAIAVTPDSREELSIALAPTEDCAADGAVCTSDGRALSSGAAAIVIGPAETNTAATGTPAISGTPQVGEELTASTSGISDADGLDNASFGYQWIRTDTDIGGATASTYTPVAADEAERLKVRVGFTDDAGHEESLTSAATDAVAAAPEPLPTVSVSNASAREGDEVEFTVSLSGASGQQVTVEYATSGGTAESGTDFAAASGTLTFAANETSQTVSVSTTDDSWDEQDETFTLTLSSPANATLGDATATGTIRDDDESLPTVSVSNASAREGDAVEFTVSLSAASGRQVTVEYATSGGTAESGTDFAAASGTLAFGTNETSKTVSVSTTDDSADEENETFTLTLSSPANATLGDATATGTIIDNDESLPTVSVSDASATEGDAVEFTVSLSAASGQQVTVEYATSGGTAESGTDFAAASGTLTFGANETSKTVSVSTTDDSRDEQDETFTLTLSSPTNATLGDAKATGTIVDDDEAPPVAVSVADASATEGDAVEFTVSLSAAGSAQVTVQYATSGGTAESGTDFAAASGTLAFGANETSKTVSVSTTDDSADEENETFTLTLSSPANATLGDATATGTIIDNDDALPPLTASFEGMPASHDGAKPFTFGLTFSEDLEDFSYKTLRDHAFDVAGGEVRGAKRQQQGSNQRWTITVKPSGNGDVTISLPQTTDCEASGAICTGDGRPLSNSPSATVAGPGTSSGSDGDEEDALLALVGDVTPDAAAAALFGGDALTDDQLAAMDQLGNRNGAYDLGDLLSWTARCRRNELSCGGTVAGADAGSLPVEPASPPRKRHGRTSPRRRGDPRSGRNMGGIVERGRRQRTMRSGAVRRESGGHGPAGRSVTGWIRALVFGVVASAWGCGIGEDVVQPQLSPDSSAMLDPGPLSVRLTVPPEARDIGAMLIVEGPGIDSLTAPGFELIQSDEASSSRMEAIIAGDLSKGPVLQVWVPHRGHLGHYRVRLTQVSGDDYGLKDLAQYGIVISR